jgi:hypothetical protein
VPVLGAGAFWVFAAGAAVEPEAGAWGALGAGV